MSNREELRRAVARAILEAQLWPEAYAKAPEAERNHALHQADAANAANERHRPRIAAPEGCQCGHDDQCAFAARAEKAEAERDEARRRFNDKDLCLHGQAPCEDLLAAERTAYSAGWIAGRDAAAEAAYAAGPKEGPLSIVTQGFVDAIRALNPPEDKP